MKEGLTKHKLADILASKLETTQREALGYVEHLLETMKKTLEAGEKLKIAGFGNFEVKTKADRRGRNALLSSWKNIIINSDCETNRTAIPFKQRSCTGFAIENYYQLAC
jgi:nucleoid DNA-binding protein